MAAVALISLATHNANIHGWDCMSELMKYSIPTSRWTPITNKVGLRHHLKSGKSTLYQQPHALVPHQRWTSAKQPMSQPGAHSMSKEQEVPWRYSNDHLFQSRWPHVSGMINITHRSIQLQIWLDIPTKQVMDAAQLSSGRASPMTPKLTAREIDQCEKPHSSDIYRCTKYLLG